MAPQSKAITKDGSNESIKKIESKGRVRNIKLLSRSQKKLRSDKCGSPSKNISSSSVINCKSYTKRKLNSSSKIKGLKRDSSQLKTGDKSNKLSSLSIKKNQSFVAAEKNNKDEMLKVSSVMKNKINKEDPIMNDKQRINRGNSFEKENIPKDDSSNDVDESTMVIAPKDYVHIYKGKEGRVPCKDNNPQTIPDDAPTVLKQIIQYNINNPSAKLDSNNNGNNCRDAGSASIGCCCCSLM